MMPYEKIDAAKGDVREVIEEYFAEYRDGFDQHMRRVSRRIAEDTRAHDAINAIAKTNGEIGVLVNLCMKANWVMREFHKVLTVERDMVERLRRYRQSVEDLKEFISQVSKHPNHPMVDWMAIPETEQERVTRIAMFAERDDGVALVPGSVEYFRDALNRIDALIELRQQTADIAMFDLVVTRKSATKTAAETAVIGQLAAHVVRTFGKPFAPQVAILAEVALGLGEVVSEDRVREALKARRRKWGDPRPVRSAK